MVYAYEWIKCMHFYNIEMKVRCFAQGCMMVADSSFLWVKNRLKYKCCMWARELIFFCWTNNLQYPVEGNAKCRHLKNDLKGTLRQVFFCLRPRIPYPSLLTHCLRVYRILIHTGKGGGGTVNQREEKRGSSSQSCVENTNMTADCLQFINQKRAIFSTKLCDGELPTHTLYLRQATLTFDRSCLGQHLWQRTRDL